MRADWENILTRDDLVGGDMTFYEPWPSGRYRQYRGPIEILAIDDEDLLHIKTEWTAVCELDGEGNQAGPWKLWMDNRFAFATSMALPIADNTSNGIITLVPHFGFFHFHAVNGSHLDRRVVEDQ